MTVLKDIERDGTEEDVGLDKTPILTVLQRQHVTALPVHQQEPGILPVIEAAIANKEIVVVAVQLLTQQRQLHLLLRLLFIKLLVGIPDLHIEPHTPSLVIGQLNRCEGGVIADMGEMAQLPAILNDETVTVMRKEVTGVWTRLHGGLLLLGCHLLSPKVKEAELHRLLLLCRTLLLDRPLTLRHWNSLNLDLLLYRFRIFRGVQSVVVHIVPVEVTGHIFREKGGNGLRTTVMGEDKRRLAVWVGAHLHLRGDERL